MTNPFNIIGKRATSGNGGNRHLRKTLLSTALFAGLLLVLLGILLFLSGHEPGPTPDQVGLLQHGPSSRIMYRS